MVRFENVGLRYGLGPEILRDLNFLVPAHSFQFLTGPSGAGKTSLLRLLFLSLRPTRGLVTLFGHDVSLLGKEEIAGHDRDQIAPTSIHALYLATHDGLVDHVLGASLLSDDQVTGIPILLQRDSLRVQRMIPPHQAHRAVIEEHLLHESRGIQVR